MGMTISEIRSYILKALPDAELQIEPLANDDDHYAVQVVHKDFENKSRVEQHKLVYDALEGLVGTKLHAMALHTAAPSAKSAEEKAKANID